MAALMQAASRLRPAARARVTTLQALAGPVQLWQWTQARGIAQTPTLLKRKGGASAFAVKAAPFRGKGGRKQNKLRKDVAPHRTHLESMRELKSQEQAAARNERLWRQLEQDEQLSRELDAAFDYLNNSGSLAEYVFAPEPTLHDVDHADALAKLNALARGDPEVLAQVGDESETDGGAAPAGKELAVEDYNFLLRVYAVKGLHEEANALLARMERNLGGGEAGAPPAAAANGSVDLQLLDELDSVPHRTPPNAQSYMYFICALTRSQQAAVAVRTLGRMKERGVFPDVPTYNSVMNVCAKANKVQWAYNILEKMQVAGLVPDKASFTVLMNAAIAENDIDRAFETFHLMRSHVTEPDVVAFSSLIHGYAKIGRVERALNLFEDLLESGLTPTQVTFNSLINACAKSHYYAHKAVEFYNEMQELYDYIPDLYTYNTVLHACAKHGDFIQAEQILRHMEKHQVPKDSFTYNTVFNVYARAQVKSIVDKAPRNVPAPVAPEEIYQRPLEFDDDGREIDLNRPGKEVYSMANLDYDQEEEDDDEDEDEAEAVDADDEEGEELSEEELAEVASLREADQNQLVVAEHEEDLFVDPEESGDFELKAMDLSDFGSFQTRNIARAEKWFNEMTEEKGITPDIIALNSMLNVYANALRLGRAEHFFTEIFPKFDVEPDKFTYRALMHMFVRAKRTASAEKLMDHVKSLEAEGELEADPVTYGLLVDHYARRRQLRRVLTLLEDADAAGVQLEEKHLKKARALTEKFGVFTDLIPEDPNAVILAGSRHKLMAKRKVRAEVIAYNKKIGKRFLLPEKV